MTKLLYAREAEKVLFVFNHKVVLFLSLYCNKCRDATRLQYITMIYDIPHRTYTHWFTKILRGFASLTSSGRVLTTPILLTLARIKDFLIRAVLSHFYPRGHNPTPQARKPLRNAPRALNGAFYTRMKLSNFEK